MLKLEFLMCGNPTDAFFAQAAIYRVMLDSLGGEYAAARLVLCLGWREALPLPERWKPYFERIDVAWANTDDYHRLGDIAQSDLTYRQISSTADISIICDADTLLLRPLPSAFVDAMRRSPALCGCIAHYPPPLRDCRGQVIFANAYELWDALRPHAPNGRLDLSFGYSLQVEPDYCPFYINLGFFAGTPSLFREYHLQQQRVLPIVRSILDNDFCEQLAVPLATQLGNIPVRSLPLSYNFPNDTIAEALYPKLADEIVKIHYLRTTLFDRHKIFAAQENFDSFMKLKLTGSNAVFQQRVLDITRGEYPFPEPV